MFILICVLFYIFLHLLDFFLFKVEYYFSFSFSLIDFLKCSRSKSYNRAWTNLLLKSSRSPPLFVTVKASSFQKLVSLSKLKSMNRNESTNFAQTFVTEIRFSKVVARGSHFTYQGQSFTKELIKKWDSYLRENDGKNRYKRRLMFLNFQIRWLMCCSPIFSR